jgi:hypothetical protein
MRDAAEGMMVELAPWPVGTPAQDGARYARAVERIEHEAEFGVGGSTG